MTVCGCRSAVAGVDPTPESVRRLRTAESTRPGPRRTRLYSTATPARFVLRPGSFSSPRPSPVPARRPVSSLPLGFGTSRRPYLTLRDEPEIFFRSDDKFERHEVSKEPSSHERTVAMSPGRPFRGIPRTESGSAVGLQLVERSGSSLDTWSGPFEHGPTRRTLWEPRYGVRTPRPSGRRTARDSRVRTTNARSRRMKPTRRSRLRVDPGKAAGGDGR